MLSFLLPVLKSRCQNMLSNNGFNSISGNGDHVIVNSNRVNLYSRAVVKVSSFSLFYLPVLRLSE